MQKESRNLFDQIRLYLKGSGDMFYKSCPKFDDVWSYFKKVTFKVNCGYFLGKLAFCLFQHPVTLQLHSLPPTSHTFQKQY